MCFMCRGCGACGKADKFASPEFSRMFHALMNGRAIEEQGQETGKESKLKRDGVGFGAAGEDGATPRH